MDLFDAPELLISKLFAHFTDANKRLFWGYLLATIILSIAILWRHNSLVKSIKLLANKRVWLHRSAKQDYLVWVVNLLIKTFLFVPLLFAVAPIAIWLSFALEDLFGDIPPLMTDKTAVAIIFTTLLFVVDDFTRYVLHYLLHRVPWLWEFHKVHHSATILTPVTVYRIHPVESLLYAMRLLLVQGLVLGVAFYLFSFQLRIIDILGANIFVFSFNVLGANLRHSHVPFSWPAVIEKWFISPVQHQVHHSRARIHRDKNLGTTLAIWDRMMGSLILSDQSDSLTFGIGDKTINRSVLSLYFAPFIEIWRKIYASLLRLLQ